MALAPEGSDLSAEKWDIPTEDSGTLPGTLPDSPATLPVELRDGDYVIPITYWAGGTGRTPSNFGPGPLAIPERRLRRMPSNSCARRLTKTFKTCSPMAPPKAVVSDSTGDATTSPLRLAFPKREPRSEHHHAGLSLR